MIKSELIEVLANQVKDLPEDLASKVVNHIIKLLSSSLEKGRRIEIRGFGSIDLRILKPRQARNPRTGKPVLTEQKRKAHFKAGKELKDMINSRIAPRTVEKRTAEAA